MELIKDPKLKRDRKIIWTFFWIWLAALLATVIWYIFFSSPVPKC